MTKEVWKLKQPTAENLPASFQTEFSISKLYWKCEYNTEEEEGLCKEYLNLSPTKCSRSRANFQQGRSNPNTHTHKRMFNWQWLVHNPEKNLKRYSSIREPLERRMVLNRCMGKLAWSTNRCILKNPTNIAQGCYRSSSPKQGIVNLARISPLISCRIIILSYNIATTRGCMGWCAEACFLVGWRAVFFCERACIGVHAARTTNRWFNRNLAYPCVEQQSRCLVAPERQSHHPTTRQKWFK